MIPNKRWMGVAMFAIALLFYASAAGWLPDGWISEPWRRHGLMALTGLATALLSAATAVWLTRRSRHFRTAKQFLPAAPLGVETYSSIDGPRALINATYEGQRVFLFVKNEGQSAEFHALMRIKGQVNSTQKDDLFCRWAHTQTSHTRIAKGQTCKIELAKLRSDMGAYQWRIETATDGKPTEIDAYYTNFIGARGDDGKPSPGPDIMLSVSVIAEPDLVNQIQKIEIILKPYNAIVRSTERFEVEK
jgi:hypothetical protein